MRLLPSPCGDPAADALTAQCKDNAWAFLRSSGFCFPLSHDGSLSGWMDRREGPGCDAPSSPPSPPLRGDCWQYQPPGLWRSSAPILELGWVTHGSLPPGQQCPQATLEQAERRHVVPTA